MPWLQKYAWKNERLASSLDQEVTRWKDRFFFDAMDPEDEDLCEDCKDSMSVAFYVSNDRGDALNWRPYTGDCSWRNCKYYKHDALDDMYEEVCKMENE